MLFLAYFFFNCLLIIFKIITCLDLELTIIYLTYEQPTYMQKKFLPITNLSPTHILACIIYLLTNFFKN